MPLLRPGATVDPVTGRPLRLPSEDELREMLADLLDKRITVTRGHGDAVPPVVGEIASFADDAGRVVSTAVADIGLVAHAGAALALIPRDTADAAVAEGAVPAALRENWYEVINILSSLLNSDGTTHVKLAGLHSIGAEDVLAEAAAVLRGGRSVHAFDVEIEGYGAGTLTFFAA